MDKPAIIQELDADWWRAFIRYNYDDICSRLRPDGFFRESVGGGYFLGYWIRTCGPLVKLWLNADEPELARRLLGFTLQVTAREGRRRVPHVIGPDTQVISWMDQVDGQAHLLLAWALYARHEAAEAEFVDSTYDQVADLMDATFDWTYFNPGLDRCTEVLPNRLVHNFYFEHSRDIRFWDTYDLLTQVFCAQALREMIRVAERRGDESHAAAWREK